MVALLVSLAVLIVATIQDLKEREVADWLNYVAVLAGIVLSMLVSLQTHSFLPLFYSVIGLLVGFGIGLFFYFTGQMGGGDAKLLAAMGALFGLNIFQPIQYWLNESFITFFINSILLSLPYAMVWSIVIAMRHREKFMHFWKKESVSKVLWIFSFIIISVGVTFSFMQQQIFTYLFYLTGIALFFALYAIKFARVTERACMYEDVVPTKLVEGDWLVKDIVIKEKIIVEKKPVGLEKEEIKKLQALYDKGELRTVRVKQGLPFVPAFLLGFIATLLFDNFILTLLGL